ncbi:TPA: hypothetical protein OT210_004305 [Klebsiella variicola]|nr:hypothetical protein [Klebsiella variicola]
MKNDALCLLYIFSLFISGCAVRQKPLPVSANIGVVPTTPQFTERQQRYTLVELKPETSRMNLQLQPVEINLLDSPGLTIGAALRHTLRQTGFSLCPAAELSSLYMLPLPAIHRHSGRILLHDALQMLAGPAWRLDVDNVRRQVCFTPLISTDYGTQRL